jgi:hypothetical protein
MCFGAELAWLAPLIASGAGVAGTMITQNEMQQNAERQAEARNRVLQATMAKNDTLAQQSRDTFAQRVADANKTQDQQQKASKSRQDVLNKAVEKTPEIQKNEGASISGSAPDIVDSDLASRMKSVIAEGKDRAKALSKLGGYGDSWLKQGFMDAQAGRDIGVTTNKAAGNSAILPYAQDIAEWKATEPISPLGAIISGVGNMYGSWAGSHYGGAPTTAASADPWYGMRRQAFIQ